MRVSYQANTETDVERREGLIYTTQCKMKGWSF